MTYMPETNLTSAPVDAEASTAEKMKTLATEGRDRTQRIANILRTAFSETREEFQAGKTVISPLAKDVTTEAVSTIKSKSQEAAEAVNKAWKDEADAPDTTERLISLIKNLLGQAKTAVLPSAKQQAMKFDQLLSDRYGSQYTTLRDRIGLVRSWIATDAAASSAVETDMESPDVESPEPVTVIEVESETVK